MKVKTRHDHPAKLVLLEWPPPEQCGVCRRKKTVYATKLGWRCWECLPEEDLADEDGIKYDKPRMSKKEEVYFNQMREVYQDRMITKNCKVCDQEIVSTGRGRPRLVHESCKPSKKQNFVLSENTGMTQEPASGSKHTPGVDTPPERL